MLTTVEESTDLKISKLIEVTKIENRWALVTEFIEGTPLDVLMKEHPEKYVVLNIHDETIHEETFDDETQTI